MCKGCEPRGKWSLDEDWFGGGGLVGGGVRSCCVGSGGFGLASLERGRWRPLRLLEKELSCVEMLEEHDIAVVEAAEVAAAGDALEVAVEAVDGFDTA